MATMTGLTGKVTGKMGNVVFRVREGQQVVTQYNPIVKNPNTTNQRGARSKFKLLSQLGEIMSSEMGSFIIKTRPEKAGKPTQRNMFMQANYDAVEEGDGVAKIRMDEIKLTNSYKSLGELSMQDGRAIVNVPDSAGYTSVKFVVVSYDKTNADGKVPVPTIKATEIVQVVNNVAVMNIPERITRESVTEGAVLAYGMKVSETSKSKTKYEGIIASIAGDNAYAATDYVTAVKSGDIVVSETLGITLYN